MARENREVLELSSDADDDEALRYAIALSLQDQQDVPPAASSSEKQPAQTNSFGSLGLDRKAMEGERLARLAGKRPRAATDEPDEDLVEIPPPKKLVTSHLSSKASASGSNSPQGDSVPYPDGVVKRTWAYGYPRHGDDIKIEEVLQRDQLELAILSSFQWDDEWLLSKIDLRKTKLLLVAFAKDEAQRNEMRENVPPNVRFTFPPMNGPGSMHSKLQVLKYPDYLRIVVPSGNLVPYDWGETGVLENMVFLIDLPRLSDRKEYKATTFSTEFSRFLRASKIDEKLVSSLEKYDFSRTEGLGFVYSAPGGHTDELRRRTGYCGLGDTVAALGLSNSTSIEVDFVAASLGSINSDLIGALYNACQGDNGMKEYTARASQKGAASKSKGLPQQMKDHVRIYFPTEQTVLKSRGGRGAAGTICVQEKWWRSSTFPTDLVRDCENTREGLLMHSKIIFVRPSSVVSETNEPSGHPGPSWAYVGSANLSESAWGRLVKDSKTGKPKMNCRNWECGVVIPVERKAITGSSYTSISPTATGAAGDLSSTFRHKVPVPMRAPGRPYGPTDEPWLYAGSR